MPGQRFLTVPDVAEVLNVSVRQVRSLLQTGELRGIQVGGRGIWRVEGTELEAYIQRQYHRTEQLLGELDDSTERLHHGDAGEHDDPPPT